MMPHYPGYTTGLDFLDDEELSLELLRALGECARGCLDMEGMSARVEAIRDELEYRREA
jgi:hypothetical protein